MPPGLKSATSTPHSVNLSVISRALPACIQVRSSITATSGGAPAWSAVLALVTYVSSLTTSSSNDTPGYLAVNASPYALMGRSSSPCGMVHTSSVPERFAGALPPEPPGAALPPVEGAVVAPPRGPQAPAMSAMAAMAARARSGRTDGMGLLHGDGVLRPQPRQRTRSDALKNSRSA